MDGRFAFSLLAKYPHMQPLDVAVWERFIQVNPDYFDRVDYDVPVGTGATPHPDHAPEIQYDHTILTQKKIDVVGYRRSEITLVEIKPIANMRALGQILTYAHLYKDDHPEVGSLILVVLAGEIERELEAIYAAHGVQIELA